MKALAWHKFRRYPKKPSMLLGFLLAVVVWAVTLLVVSELTGRIYVWDTEPIGLAAAQWVVLAGVVAAVVGWIISAMVTMRNSIKQHTINTLLQSRLSATYMENARAVNRHYFGPSGSVYTLTREELSRPADDIKLRELSYLLNYLEFISAATRFGDLDEKLLRMTLRGMLCNLYEVSLEYIKASQTTNATSFEHLSWLYDYWFDPVLQRTGVPRPQAAAATEPAPPERKSREYSSSAIPLIVAVGAALYALTARKKP